MTYHGKIMNIRVSEEARIKAIHGVDLHSSVHATGNRMYVIGHRDARHAAAEIANDAEAEIVSLREENERLRKNAEHKNVAIRKLITWATAYRDGYHIHESEEPDAMVDIEYAQEALNAEQGGE